MQDLPMDLRRVSWLSGILFEVNLFGVDLEGDHKDTCLEGPPFLRQSHVGRLSLLGLSRQGLIKTYEEEDHEPWGACSLQEKRKRYCSKGCCRIPSDHNHKQVCSRGIARKMCFVWTVAHDTPYWLCVLPVTGASLNAAFAHVPSLHCCGQTDLRPQGTL